MVLTACAWMLFGTAHAEPATLEISVEPAVVPPRPERERFDSPPITAGRIEELSVDGLLGEWAEVPLAPAPRSQTNRPPPDPAWTVQVARTDAGLVFAVRGLEPDVSATLSVDPDGTRRGWVAVEVGADGQTLQRCFGGPEIAEMPAPSNWTGFQWPCGESVAANAVRGPDGWEVLIPWSTLGDTTDDLLINFLAATREATASYDKRGGTRVYPGGGRLLVAGDPRTDILIVGYDRAAGAMQFTLRGPKLAQPEPWTVLAWRNGVVLSETEVSLGAERGYAMVDGSLPVPDAMGVTLVARRHGDEPMRPGTSTLMWQPGEQATLATPVFQQEVRVRLSLARPQKPIAVAVRTPDGTVLGSGQVDVDRGQQVLIVPIDPTWPDALELDVGGLFANTWAPILRGPEVMQ